MPPPTYVTVSKTTKFCPPGAGGPNHAAGVTETTLSRKPSAIGAVCPSGIGFARLDPGGANVAATPFARRGRTVQVALPPWQVPLQATNAQPEPGRAVRLSFAPARTANVLRQRLLQASRRPSLRWMLPRPVIEIVSGTCRGVAAGAPDTASVPARTLAKNRTRTFTHR